MLYLLMIFLASAPLIIVIVGHFFLWETILVGLSIFFVGWRFLVQGRSFYKPLKIDLLLAFIGVIALLSWTVNVARGHGNYTLNLQTLSLVFFLFVVRLASTFDLERETRFSMYWMVILGGMFALQALHGYLLGGGVRATRNFAARGFLMRLWGPMDPNNLAGLLDLVIPLSFVWAVQTRELLKKLLLMMATLLMFTTVLFTFSRGSWITQTIVLGTIIIMQRGKRVRALWILSLVVIPLSVALGAFALRFNAILSPFDAASLSRPLLWRAATNAFSTSPLLGLGFGNFAIMKTQFGMYSAFDPYGYLSAHNIFFELLADLGILGFVGMFWLIGRAIIGLIGFIKSVPPGNGKILGIGILGGLVTYLLHGLFDSFLQMPVTLLVFGILLGFSFNLARNRPRT
jgi:O-antigen ligase